jgi:hypothetical protein
MSDKPLITLKVKNERGDLIMPRGFFDDVVVANMNAIQRVRDLHQPVKSNLKFPDECGHCWDKYGAVWWPCPTIRALDGEQDV